MADTQIPVRGSGRVLVSTPLHWGQVDRLAWSMEHGFPRVSDRIPGGQPDEPRISGAESWVYTKTAVVPALRAVTLAPYPHWVDHWVSGMEDEEELRSVHGLDSRGEVTYWEEVAGSWTVVAPVGYGDHLWLATRDMSYASNAIVETKVDWGEEQSVMFLLWTWAPTWTYDGRPYFRFTIGKKSTGTGGIGVAYPFYAPDEGGGSEWYDVEPRPRILNDSEEVLAYIDDPSVEDAAAALRPQLRVFTVRAIEPGVYIVSVSGGGQVLIHDKDLRLHEGPLRVTCRGVGVAFTVVPLQFRSTGTIEKLTPALWPTWVGDEEVVTKVRHTLVDDDICTTSVTVDAQLQPATGLLEDAGMDYSSTQMKIDMSTTWSRYSPVVYLAQEVHKQELLEADQRETDISGYIDRMVVYETPDGRASKAYFEATTSDGVVNDLWNNSWCELSVAQEWSLEGGAPSAEWGQEYQLLSGFLWRKMAGVENFPIDPKRGLAVLYPWSSRLRSKTMLSFGEVSWADWPLEDLVKTMLPGLGVPEDMIEFDLPDEDMLDELRIPCERKWERRYSFGYDAPFIESFDQLLATVHCRWRCSRDGKIVVFMPLPWDGIPDWTLDDTVLEWRDVAKSFRSLSDQESVATIFFHIGMGTFGELLMGAVVDEAAMKVSSHPNFVGEDRWSVRVDLANADPQASAEAEYERAHRYQRRVTWDWLAHPHWKVGDRVEVAYDGVDVPRGTVVEILGKVGRISDESMEYRESVEAGVIRWP